MQAITNLTLSYMQYTNSYIDQANSSYCFFGNVSICKLLIFKQLKLLYFINFKHIQGTII